MRCHACRAHLVLVTVAACLPGAAHAAGATIIFASERDGDSEIYSMNADGGNVVQLTYNTVEDFGTACSPDGRLVAFTSERDGNPEIYVMNADGTGLRRITNHPAGDFNPDWSRDGSMIAFTSDRDGDREIFVVDADGGSPMQLTHNSSVENGAGWSPDGSRIAFHSDQSGAVDIWAVDAAGGNLQNLTHDAAPDYLPDYSPDGSSIVFESTRDGPLELYLMDADGGNIQRLTYTGSDNHEPDWSPDGSTIMFTSLQGTDYDIMLINATGTGLTNLTTGSISNDWGPSWLPEAIDDTSNGGGTGVLAYCKQPVAGPDLKQIYTIHLDGTGKRQLVSAPVGLNHHEWSPDGRRLAAVGYVNASTWSIYTFDADGSNLTRLTHTAGVWDNEPSWSPDGQQLAWGRIYPSDGYRAEIWMMNEDGTDQRAVGVDGDGVRWSPDGSRLLYFKESTTIDIWSCDVDGSDEQQLTAGPGNNMVPDYSPDGSKIVFVSTRDGNYELYVMDSNGSSLRRLTNNPTLDHDPTWSPDGSLIAFVRDVTGGDRFEVFAIDSTGANLRRVTYSPPDLTAINPDWQPNDTTMVPVYLQGLSHVRDANSVRLLWQVVEEAAEDDFRVVARQEVHRRELRATKVGPRSFEAVDSGAALLAGGEIVYDLYASADRGGWDLLGSERVELRPAFEGARIVGLYPNPCNPHTTISFVVDRPQPVRIEIHDVAGRRVATLFDDNLPVGYHSSRWNGTDEKGNEVASGVYFVTMTAGKKTQARKLTLVR